MPFYTRTNVYRWSKPWMGTHPRRMTKGLRRQLAKVKRQNNSEYERQNALIGSE